MLRAILRDQRGLETVQYVAMSGVIVTMIMAIWLVFYGGPGRSLRGAVQTQIGVYANGFEGGLGTNGPVGRVPDLSRVRVRFDPTPFRPNASQEQASKTGAFSSQAKAGVDFNPTQQQAVPFDPTALQEVPFVPEGIAAIVLQPMPTIRVTLDSQHGTATLFEPTQQRMYVVDTVRGTASVVDLVTNARQPISLVELQQIGVVAIRTVPQATQIIQSIKTVVQAIPMLLS